MENTSSLNPMRLKPEELAERLGPFSSWPQDGGLPMEYFSMPVTDHTATFYQDQGFAVIHEAFTRAELDELISETFKICRNEDGTIQGVDPVTSDVSDLDAMKRVLCLHFPHKLSEVFRRALSHPGIKDLLTRVVSPNVKCMQSMLFVKAAGKPGQAWHQDEDFIPTRDRSLVGAWIALDDATVENGCLWVLPGSQRRGVLWPQKFHFDTRFDCARESFDFPWADEDSVPVEMKAGSIVFFNGYLLHRSLPNRTASHFRRSLVNHYMSAESLLPWRNPPAGTAVAVADYRDIVMIAGEDPYAFKGTENIARAYVRADGQGGCADWTNEEQKKLARDYGESQAAKSEMPVMGG